MKDKQRKEYLASLADRLVLGQMDRRNFLCSACRLGLAAGALGLGLGNRPFGLFPLAHAQPQPSADIMVWLKDVAKPFAGTTLKLATESTPPSKALDSQLKRYFEQATGITVEIELLPLENVLEKLTRDVASSLGAYDLYYIDQSWAASFSSDVLDPREQYAAKADLAMPHYNIDDFLPALVEGIVKYKDRWVGVPTGSAPSTSGWYWSMVKSSGAARPSVTLRLKYADSTRSTSPESLLTVVPSGNRICTGGKSPPRRGGSTNAALQSSRLGKSLTLFALTTLPVSLSMSAYARSPKTPRSVTSTSWSCSPPMDFTGNLHSVATEPTSSLIAMW